MVQNPDSQRRPEIIQFCINKKFSYRKQIVRPRWVILEAATALLRNLVYAAENDLFAADKYHIMVLTLEFLYTNRQHACETIKN